MVKLLLDNNALVNLQNDEGLSSLMYASENDHVDVVKVLLEYS